MREKSKEDEQHLEERNSAHHRSQAKCNCSCFCHIINILLTELSRLDLDRVYRPNAMRSVLTTSVKILPYRPPARIIRAKESLDFLVFYTPLLDINECDPSGLSADHQDLANECHGDANCTNIKGSYNCGCQEGYQGNGNQCDGKLLSRCLLTDNISRLCPEMCLYG